MKAVKYILLGLAPLVLIVGLWMYLSRGDGRARELPTITLVDVMTGDIDTVDRSDVVSLPARNQRDRKRTLYPVFRNDAGEYEIDERLRASLIELSKTESVKIDLKTFTVKPD